MGATGAIVSYIALIADNVNLGFPDAVKVEHNFLMIFSA